jgi:CubicO group peptidase (beta-lactamase class C family)
MEFERPDEIRKLIGAYTITTQYYAGSMALDAPEKPGPYFAVVTVKAKAQPTVTRYVTLFQLATAPRRDWKFNPEMPAELAKIAGLDPTQVERQTRLIAEVCKERPFGQLASDPKFAKLLAGLSLMPKETGKISKQNDAFAIERQAWVTLQMALPASPLLRHHPLDRPTILTGMPATVVHTGTEVEAGVKPGTAAKIDAVLTDWATNDDQAFAVCIVHHGVIVLHKAYGTRDNKPMTVDTPSWMASITKTMSATCLMMLVDAGAVKLDDPVGNYTRVPVENAIGKPLLVRNLYTHTSGLARWPGELQRDELPDIEQRAALALPYTKIGWGFWYGGQGYSLGGKLIENVSGEAMPLFYKKHLLDPLGMTGTEVVGTHADAFSVPLDVAKFGQMLLNKGSYGSQRFFSPETFQTMLPHPLARELNEPEQEPGLRTFGIGLDGQPNRIGHGAASAATFSVDLDRDLVVVMTRNRQGKNQDKYNGKFWDAINSGLQK